MSNEMNEEEIKFNDQEFLSTYIDEIIGQVNSTGVDSFNYQHIYKLNTSVEPFPVSIAKLTGKSESVSLNKMTSYQHSALVPRIRLFRVQGFGTAQKEYEFEFPKTTKYLASSDDSNILHTPKGYNCGIVNVEYKLAGTNPVTAERSIEVVLELHFDSINAFSGGDYDEMLSFWKDANSFNISNKFDDDTKKTTINYWSLIMHPAYKKQQNDRYNPRDFRIRAQIGWESLEPSFKKELFSNLPNIDDDLSDTNLSVILQLVMHHFTFNEDGSIRLKIEYIASIENVFATNKFNIFKGLKEEIEEKTANLASIVAGFQIRSKLAAYIKDNSGNLNTLQEQLKNCGNEIELGSSSVESLIQQINQINSYSETALENYIKSNQEWVDNYYQKDIDRTVLKIKQDYYKKLYTKLLDKSNIKSLSVNNDIATKWLRYRNKKPSSSKPALAANAVLDTNNADLKQTDEVKERLKQTQYQQRVELEDNQELSLAALWKSIAPSEKDESAEIQSFDNYQINFTTIGSIIDSAYEIFIEAEKSDSVEIEEIQRNKVILSSFSNQLAQIGKVGTTNYNIADIPVSISKLSEFLLTNIVHPQKQAYTLKEFLSDVMNQLVETTLNSRTLINTKDNKYSNTSMAFTTFTLKGTSNPLDSFRIESRIEITTFGKEKKDIRQYYPKDKLVDGENYYNYFLIYDKYLKDFDGLGDRLEDEKRGIYHFSIGQNYGLLKQATFKRVDQPGLREAKSLGKDTIFLGQFRDRYNADLVLVGNNMFTPGMVVFITPSVEVGNPADPNSFSQISGIGGYYTVISVNSSITQGEYKTTLDCIFHSAGPSASSLKNKQCDLADIEKAGFINPDGEKTELVNMLNGINTFISQQRNLDSDKYPTKAEEERRQEEEKAAENLQSFAGAAGL